MSTFKGAILSYCSQPVRSRPTELHSIIHDVLAYILRCHDDPMRCALGLRQVLALHAPSLGTRRKPYRFARTRAEGIALHVSFLRHEEFVRHVLSRKIRDAAVPISHR